MAVTRRAALGAMVSVSAVAVPALAFASQAPTKEEADFIAAIAFLHPNGRAVAIHALELGLRPSELYEVRLVGGAKQELPELRFNKHDTARRVFVTPIDFFHDQSGVSVAREI